MIKFLQVPFFEPDEKGITAHSFNYDDGDYVSKGSVILVIETTKITLDLTAPCDGFVRYLISEGEQLEVEQEIVVIADEVGELEL